jgi:hypothetical protein
LPETEKLRRPDKSDVPQGSARSFNGIAPLSPSLAPVSLRESEMNETAIMNATTIEDVFARYHVGWDTKNPDLIASLHSDDTIFWVHDGTPPVKGRDALRAHCAALFQRSDFQLEMGRLFYGANHWVFEWTMVLNLKDQGGAPFTARVEMLDLVTINADSLVTRKDVYMNGRQASAAFQRAGIDTAR